MSLQISFPAFSISSSMMRALANRCLDPSQEISLRDRYRSMDNNTSTELDSKSLCPFLIATLMLIVFSVETKLCKELVRASEVAPEHDPNLRVGVTPSMLSAYAHLRGPNYGRYFDPLYHALYSTKERGLLNDQDNRLKRYASHPL